MFRTTLLLATVIAVAGCTSYPVSTTSRPDAYYEAYSADTTEASLFAGDATVLSDVAINAILNYDYTPPELSRIALMPFGREIWSTWSEELSLASAEMRSTVIDRLFSPDISRASCGVEAVLLDTRTGLVPFTSVASHSYDVEENDEDVNFRETRLRAQLTATSQALADVSGEIAAYLADSTTD